MIIIGAKGFAKELLEVCHQLGRTDDLVFFDNISLDLPEKIFGQFSILRNEEEVKTYFELKGRLFALGLGHPAQREKMAELFEVWGGELTSLISPYANIGSFEVEIGRGATILARANISNSVKIGKGVLMYPNSIVTHDCIIGDFVELSPGATLLGNVKVGALTHLAANSTILPKLDIGERCIIGAGALVTKNVVDGKTVKGVPAK